jgi:alpha/beta superfamily hydrolase
MNPTSASSQAGSHLRCSALDGSCTTHLEHEFTDSRPQRPMHEALAAGSHPVSRPAKTSAAGSIRSVILAGPAGRIEAVLNLDAADAPFAALVCHPHPVFGGTLHNKVAYHAMKALNDPIWGLGWPVLRFNFRGAGLSEGAHDGEAETGDVLAALDWLANEFQRPLIVTGFSFGAAMALRACFEIGSSRTPGRPHRDVRALAALGLPVQVPGRVYHYSFLRSLAIPKLFVSGDGDQFAPAAQLEQIATSAAEPKRIIVVPDADHFFSGQLEPMQRAVAGWLKEQLL